MVGQVTTVLWLVLLVGCTDAPNGCSNTTRHPSSIWKSYQTSPIGNDIRAVKGPDAEQVANNGEGSAGVFLPCFSPTQVEHLHTSYVFPRVFKTGGAGGLTLFWSQRGAGTGNVVWGQEVLFAPNGAPLLGPTTILTFVFPAPGIDGGRATAVFPAPAFPGTDNTTALIVRLFRDVDDPADTLDSAEACTISFRTDYTSDVMGTGTR